MAISLLKQVLGSWDRVQGYLKQDLDTIERGLNDCFKLIASLGGSAGGVGVSAYVVCALDEDAVDDTLDNDAELTVSLEASSLYLIEMGLLFTSGASSVPGVKLTVSLPGATISGGGEGVIGADLSNYFLLWSFSQVAGAASPASLGAFSVIENLVTPITLRLVVRTTAAGIFQLQWAQDVTTGGSPTVRKRDSWLRWTRLQ